MIRALLIIGALAACSDSGSERDAGIDADLLDDAGTPDLAIFPDTTVADMAIEEQVFAPNSCELHRDEDCVGAPGIRKLLRFSVLTPNLGDADIYLGSPFNNEKFQYSPCHDHYHLIGYADYRVKDGEGAEFGWGHKQAFCVTDSFPFIDAPYVSEKSRYTCSEQGLQAGWADLYAADLPCQFVDITDVEDGIYNLEITVNTREVLDQDDPSNNMATISFDLSSPDLLTPSEDCPDLDPRALVGRTRECGWTLSGSLDCTPGESVELGCSQVCGEADSCGGNPMIRICDADTANCTATAALGFAISDTCRGPCPATTVECPQSGEVVVYKAPIAHGDPYECEIAGLSLASP